MPLSQYFKVQIDKVSPLAASEGGGATEISAFLTTQSFANFAAMAGAISAAWHALQAVVPGTASLWVPYGLSIAWGVISILISLDSLEGKGPGEYGAAMLIAFLNSLVLAGAVVGTSGVVNHS